VVNSERLAAGSVGAKPTAPLGELVDGCIASLASQKQHVPTAMREALVRTRRAIEEARALMAISDGTQPVMALSRIGRESSPAVEGMGGATRRSWAAGPLMR